MDAADIFYFDRQTKKMEKEKVYGRFFLQLLYGDGLLSKVASSLLLPPLAKVPFFSQLYGLFQKSRFSRSKVIPFIQEFDVDVAEFLDPVSSFSSFNDFFIRKLNLTFRPLAQGENVAVLPADARYLVYPQIDMADGFVVKGKKFSLRDLLQDDALAKRYANGAMVIARLCPTDYHRFHFPCSGTPGTTRLINGPLYSVNPLALKKNIEILSENKRVITEIDSKAFGKVLYIEVGATNVGSISQTYSPGVFCPKGAEKGYFSFGGSSLIVLFEQNTISFDADLVEQSAKKIEVRALFGQSLGRSVR
ncbi:MAG: phosphatidylserine decarboxylase [Chlamydiota bacterium]